MLLQEHMHFLAGVVDQSGWMMCSVVEQSPDLLTVDTVELAVTTVVILRMLA